MFSETCMSKPFGPHGQIDCPLVGRVQVPYSPNGMELPISIMLEKRLTVGQSRKAGGGNSWFPLERGISISFEGKTSVTLGVGTSRSSFNLFSALHFSFLCPNFSKFYCKTQPVPSYTLGNYGSSVPRIGRQGEEIASVLLRKV